MRQILLAMCLGRLAGPRSVGGKFTLQRRTSPLSSLDVYFGHGIRPRMKWINPVTNMDASWKSQLESDFFSDLRGLDLFHLREWAQGLQVLDSLKGSILVSQVAGKLGMEAVQLAMQEGLCAGRGNPPPVLDPRVGARLGSIDGVPKFCNEAISWIPTMLDSVDDFLKIAIVLTGERSATTRESLAASAGTDFQPTFEDAVARLIHAICDLEFIRGVILARMVNNNPFVGARPGSHAIFANQHEALRRLLGLGGTAQDICGEASKDRLRWLKDKMTLTDTVATFARLQPTMRGAAGFTAESVPAPASTSGAVP